MLQQHTSLDAWLDWQQSLHFSAIDLGLDRVCKVLDQLLPAGFPTATKIITVAGTNGKGSCVAIAEALLKAGGHSVGTYTSPHLIRYNERVRINGEPVSDAALCDAFSRIDQARLAGDEPVSLTFFEFGTLAALLLFADMSLDAVVLEVGLGGRLDAVNAVDADVAIVSSIGLDHTDWLGYDLAQIAREKAGVARAGKPFIIARRDVPDSLREAAEAVKADVLQVGSDFSYDLVADAAQLDGEGCGLASGWTYRFGSKSFKLPPLALAGEFQYGNAAAAITALTTQRLCPSMEACANVLTGLSLAGRMQRLTTPSGLPVLLDVAHNADSAAMLAQTLATSDQNGGRPKRRLALFGMMEDKDQQAVISALNPLVDQWWLTAAELPRASAAQDLAELFEQEFDVLPANLAVSTSVEHALEDVLSIAQPGDELLVFGSFYIVGPALQWLTSRSKTSSSPLNAGEPVQ